MIELARRPFSWIRAIALSAGLRRRCLCGRPVQPATLADGLGFVVVDVAAGKESLTA